MTMYVAIAREREDWSQTYEFERDELSLAQAALVIESELPPDWILISVREAG
jgi:hypothetical protein